ncbi:hypothetical protein E3Q14_02147 [Wallemia mellicola]|nr:hypothetical protein E3Q14_02147 [Wallemia mellicola]
MSTPPNSAVNLLNDTPKAKKKNPIRVIRSLVSRQNSVKPESFKPLPDEIPFASLRVQVINAKDLASKDRNGLSDPFVDINYGLLRLSTPCVKKTLNPVWDANDATFDISLFRSTVANIAQLEFVAWDKDTIGKDYLGECSLYLDDWFPKLKEGEPFRAVQWSDHLNNVRTLQVKSARKNNNATGVLNVRLGLIQHPASSPVNLESVFEDVLSNARKVATGIMAAPPIESIGTSLISSHSLSQQSTRDSTRTIVASNTQDSLASTLSRGTTAGNNDIGDESDTFNDSDVDITISDIEGDEVDNEDESNVPTPTVGNNDSETFIKGSMRRSESQPMHKISSNLSPMDIPTRPGHEVHHHKRPSKLKRIITPLASRQNSRDSIPLATTPQGDISEPNLSSHSNRSLKPRKRRIRKSSRTAKTGGFNLNSEDNSNVLGVVLLEVRHGTDLPRMKNMTRTGWDMDPFVVISFGKKIFRTRVIRHSLNPTWDEKLYFHVRQGESKYTVDFCKFSLNDHFFLLTKNLAVLDWDKLSANDHVGDVSLPLQELVSKAPKSDPETGLFNSDEYDTHTMDDYRLDLKIHENWEEKHSPNILIRAKYLPYAALRQRFWRSYLDQYDADDTGSISRVELTMMLDSLGSTLTSVTIDSFFTRWDKNPRSDELTYDQIIQVLENETNKPINERRSLDDDADADETDASVSPGPSTPSALTAYNNNIEPLDYTGPLARPPNAQPGIIEEHSKASKPKNGGTGNEIDIANISNTSNDESSKLKVSTDFLDNSRLSPPAAGFLSSSSSVFGYDVSDYDDSTELEKGTVSDFTKMKIRIDESHREKVINIKVCPLCHKGRLNSKAEVDIVTHLAICASTDWGRLNRVAVSNYVTASQAQRKWISKIASKISTGSYKLGANSANILVQDRLSGRLQEEKMQMYVRIGIRMLYKGARSKMEGSRARRLLKSMSIKQGSKYDDPESVREIPNFIQFHNLNMDEVLEPISAFNTFNQFFYRKLKPDARPVEEADNPGRLVSAADCRMVVFDNFESATKIWIKGRGFTVSRLLGEKVSKESWCAPLLDKEQLPSLSVFRLAPQDYHRFHSPVDGIIGPITTIEGEYYTVNPQAVRSPISIFSENVRVIVPIHTESYGTVIAVCIGAMMVGSTILTKKEGDSVQRGEEFGYFAFGGSTIVCLFPPNTVSWDNDIKENSRAALETLVRVGMGIGKLSS